MKSILSNVFVSYLLTAVTVISALYLIALPWLQHAS